MLSAVGVTAVGIVRRAFSIMLGNITPRYGTERVVFFFRRFFLDFFTGALVLANRSGDDEFASLKALAVTTATCEHGMSQISRTAMTGDSLADLGIESPRLSLLCRY
jgi:hypothetical protein